MQRLCGCPINKSSFIFTPVWGLNFTISSPLLNKNFLSLSKETSLLCLRNNLFFIILTAGLYMHRQAVLSCSREQRLIFPCEENLRSKVGFRSCRYFIAGNPCPLKPPTCSLE